MARRKSKSNVATVERTDTIETNTIKLGWGDRRGNQVKGVGLYVYFGERFMHQSFDTLSVGKHMLDLLIGDDEVTWGLFPRDVIGDVRGIDNEPLLITSSGVKIRGAGLEAAMEYEYQSEAERSFVFPPPYDRMFASWTARGMIDTEPKQQPKQEAVYDPETHTIIKSAKKPKAEKVTALKVDKTGLTAIAQVCTDNGWDAKHARAALRKAKIDKPAAGWAFTAAELPAIVKAIKENIKK